MSKRSLQDVADAIECEGLGYAIQHYLSAKNIADTHLASLWQKTNDVLDAIDNKLTPYLDNVDEDCPLSTLAWYVEGEGLDYAIQSGTDADETHDEDLIQKWNEAKDLLSQIESILRPYMD